MISVCLTRGVQTMSGRLICHIFCTVHCAAKTETHMPWFHTQSTSGHHSNDVHYTIQNINIKNATIPNTSITDRLADEMTHWRNNACRAWTVNATTQSQKVATLSTATQVIPHPACRTKTTTWPPVTSNYFYQTNCSHVCLSVRVHVCISMCSYLDYSVLCYHSYGCSCCYYQLLSCSSRVSISQTADSTCTVMLKTIADLNTQNETDHNNRNDSNNVKHCWVLTKFLLLGCDISNPLLVKLK